MDTVALCLYHNYSAIIPTTPHKGVRRDFDVIWGEYTHDIETPQIKPVIAEITDTKADTQRDSEPHYITVLERRYMSSTPGATLLLECTTYDRLKVGDVIVYRTPCHDFYSKRILYHTTRREPVRTIGNDKMIGDSRRKMVNGSPVIPNAPVWRLVTFPLMLTDADYGVLKGAA